MKAGIDVSTLSRLGQAAVKHAAAGRAVFPCAPRDKVPLTRRGFKDASADAETVAAWWREHPDANIGLATGGGVFVVDVDVKNGGTETFYRLQEENGRLPDTLSARTGGGGFHFFLRHPPDQPVKSQNGVLTGLDVKGEGGYVVLPPSVHPITGEAYRWENKAAPADAPEWLLELLAKNGDKPPISARSVLDKLEAGKRNTELTRLAGLWRRKGLDPDAILGALRVENEKRCEPALPDAELRKIARSSANWEPEEADPADPEAPIILVKAGELPRVVKEAAAALRRSGAELFDRGGMLVRPVRLDQAESGGGVRRPAGAVVLKAVEPDWVRLRLAESAFWRAPDKRRRGGERPIDPPGMVARTLAAVPDAAAWPYLLAVVGHPALTPDGRILGPGYDAETALLVETRGVWTPLPERPTRDDADAAAAKLADLLRHYPWDTDCSRAVGLSLIVTALMRPTLDFAPLHAIDSPAAGTGKSLLVDVAAILATGAPATVVEWSADPTESGKRLDGAMLAGDPIVSLDNIETALEGAALCQALSQTHRRVRPLGSSALATVPCVQTVAATGNNLTLRGDVTRRALVCRLDAKCERPELRRIDQDLLAETLERRRELVAAALTIPLAYIRAGRPDQRLDPIGGFKQWSETVRAALVWSCEADPGASMSTAREVDPDRAEAAAVFSAWDETIGGEWIAARHLIGRAEMVGGDLDEALRQVATVRGEVNPHALGLWLRGKRDARIGGFVLRGRQESRRAVWRIVKVTT